jgi:hypothetical protein
VRTLFLFLVFAGAAAGGFSLDAAAYRQTFSRDCRIAEQHAAAVRPLLRDALDGDEALTRIGLAVIYPELTRYSYIRDGFETAALEVSYIVGGDVDYSIGLLQMKPSFAKMLEADAGGALRTRYPQLFTSGRDDREDRSLRVGRLKNLSSQTTYLAVFLRLMETRFPGLRGETAVRIFSAAYNAGYHRTIGELEVYARRYFFPYGIKHREEQYSYSEIALDYYRSLS